MPTEYGQGARADMIAAEGPASIGPSTAAEYTFANVAKTGSVAPLIISVAFAASINELKIVINREGVTASDTNWDVTVQRGQTFSTNEHAIRVKRVSIFNPSTTATLTYGQHFVVKGYD